MDPAKTRAFVEQTWDRSILPALEDYIRIPNLSPAFDPDWAASGHMDRAAALIARWIESQEIPGLSQETVRLEGRTPLLFVEVPGDTEETVLLYGHLDKQPPMEGWSDGLEPFTPVIRDGKLYGRGGADDGYAAFASLTAIRALKRQGVPVPRTVTLIEGCEESGSFDLPHYIDALADRIGTPSLVVCLDSGCGNYDQLWSTTSLRGVLVGFLKVDILREGVHSGDAGGIVPSSFRILRRLLSRLEDEETGEILPRELHAAIPEQRLRQARRTAEVLGDETWSTFPWVPGAGPATKDPTELILNRSWRPALAITGAAGLPPLEQAGNVLRTSTSVKLSLRLPPTITPETAEDVLSRLLLSEPPHGAKVTFETEQAAGGWSAPDLEPWLEEATGRASREFFGREACYMGEGGSIPFMGMLGEKYPAAQFLITGVLGPQSNAHGPNEFLHIETGKRLTGCVAQILTEHYRAKTG